MELPAHDVAKQGYLKFKGKMGMWQKQWAVLKKKSSKGGRRLEQYSDEKSSYNQNKPADKTIILEGVASIQQVPADVKKHALAISFVDKNNPPRTFCCDSAMEAAAWQAALQTLCLRKDVPAPVNSSMGGIDLLQSGPSQKELTEVFNVYLLPSLNLAFYGECMLQVTTEYMHLLESNNPGKRLTSWPLNALRRYGSDETKFTFESGRFCDTGEGIFILTTKDADAIYKKVHNAALAIAEMHRLMHKHHAQTIRTQSLPGGHRETPPPGPLRSISSPGSGVQGPEPPPRPMGASAGRGRKFSAVDLSLPPLPGSGLLSTPGTHTGEYLVCPTGGLYNDTDLPPPTEMAPPLPNNHPAGYLPMTGDLGRDDYISLKDRQGGQYLSLKRPKELLDAAIDGIKPPGSAPPGEASSSSCATYVNQIQELHGQESVYGGHQQAQQAFGAARGAAGDGAVAGQQPQEEDYIYYEKGLTPAFRNYLKDRKEDE